VGKPTHDNKPVAAARRTEVLGGFLGRLWSLVLPMEGALPNSSELS